jgi:hypothetical protein
MQKHGKAPLVVTDINDLGDKRLSPIEANCKLREENQRLIDAKKIPNQALLEDHDMALGNPMSPNDFIQKIKKLNPAIIVEDGGVYGAVAVRLVGTDPETGEYGKRYISGFYKNEMLPEFSSIITDEKGLPKREVRGWRSVLLALLKSGAVTFPQLKAAFGEPQGSRNILWRQQTQERRA